MKRIINSKFKFCLSTNLNKKIITLPVKHIKSSAGIRAPATNKKDKIDIVKYHLKILKRKMLSEAD